MRNIKQTEHLENIKKKMVELNLINSFLVFNSLDDDGCKTCANVDDNHHHHDYIRCQQLIKQEKTNKKCSRPNKILFRVSSS